MFPKLLSYGSWVLPTYGVLVATGFVAGVLLAARLAAREGLDKQKIYNLGIYVALAGMLGAKLFLVVQDWDYYRQQPGQIFSMSTLQSGGIFYGGLLTAIAVAFWYARRSQLPFWKTADAFAPGIALGFGIGRLGCFSAGCCWGEPTSLAWGVTFTDPYSHDVVGVPLGIPLHPTQLYESAAGLAIFAFLYHRYARKQFEGQILGWYLLLYPAARFGIEFLRSHPTEAFFWGTAISNAQAVSVALMVVGAWLLWLRPRRHLLASPAVASNEPTVSRSKRAAKLSRH
ncbi:MAG: prolipoprotein diacylglyceryl transferase [Acidobacteria bacterium]|nr:prolipoprotein diacylglyceryl transferase [Acidobacteriota bacterium]